MRTEDEVRDEAKVYLGFDKNEKNIKQGTGQITTFNQLGFVGIIDKPDGWYLPDNTNEVAIILETKAEKMDLNNKKWEDELFKNCDIALTKYKKVVGILYNGKDTRIFLNKVENKSLANELQSKEYYLKLFTPNTLDKNRIFNLTKRINDSLHFNFGIKNLYHRMIFTACALVAQRYDGKLSKIKGLGYSIFHTSIHSTLGKSLLEYRKQNEKLDILLEVYSDIRMNSTENQQAIDEFIDCVIEISDCVNSDYWNGEDVMGIFFNEFNRYKKKSESGQVFTPDHITSLMYRLIDVNHNDYVLDAACGSGAFLVKSMANMINEIGGINSKKAIDIKQNHLFGIEFDREIFALACANMLIHKDGKTNLTQLDSRTEEACAWIRNNKKITKVLMNPPFERKYGCMKIVGNVLDNVPVRTQCAFILPDKKLEKDGGKKLLKKHKLKKIIKLPEKVFFEGVTTSIFIFESGVPQNNEEIFTCYIEDDGLETVKNQGRQDIKNRWEDIENKWVEIIRKQSGHETCEWIKPIDALSYQAIQKTTGIEVKDYKSVILDDLLLKNKINIKEFKEQLLEKILYSSEIIKKENNSIDIQINSYNNNNLDITNWKEFDYSKFFILEKTTKIKKENITFDGTIPVYSSETSNGGFFGNTNLEPNFFITKENPFYIIFGDHTKTFNIVENNFCVMDNVKVLKPLIYNKYVIRFILIVWQKYIPNLGYARHWSEAKITKIKLPVTSNGMPDFEYMENYMIEIENKMKKWLQ